jgi:hypothetical protein
MTPAQKKALDHMLSPELMGKPVCIWVKADNILTKHNIPSGQYPVPGIITDGGLMLASDVYERDPEFLVQMGMLLELTHDMAKRIEKVVEAWIGELAKQADAAKSITVDMSKPSTKRKRAKRHPKGKELAQPTLEAPKVPRDPNVGTRTPRHQTMRIVSKSSGTF